MKKRILILSIVLALVAAIVPMAAVAAGPVSNTGTSVVSGSLTTASITISVQPTLNFGTFKSGLNLADWEANNPGLYGTVTVTPGTSGVTNWTVTAKGNAYMANGSTKLIDPLLISTQNGAWSCADGTSSGTVQGTAYSGICTYSGTDATHNFDFWSAQYIESGDTTVGSFTDTITFDASCIP